MPVYKELGKKPRALCVLDKYPTNCTVAPVLAMEILLVQLGSKLLLESFLKAFYNEIMWL